MIIIYRLKEDKRRIEQIQRATLTTENFGVEPTHGMFGSDEWWQNVELGQLPIHTLRGRIKDVYMGSMGDWPEFRMVGDTGDESSWTRWLQSAEQDQFYRVGARIEIDYVWQQSRAKSFDHGARHEHAIEVRIDPTLCENAPPSG